MDHIHTAIDGLSCSYIVSVLTVDVNTQSAANRGVEVQRTEPEKENDVFLYGTLSLRLRLSCRVCVDQSVCVSLMQQFRTAASVCVRVWINRKEMGFGSIEAV